MSDHEVRITELEDRNAQLEARVEHIMLCFNLLCDERASATTETEAEEEAGPSTQRTPTKRTKTKRTRTKGAAPSTPRTPPAPSTPPTAAAAEAASPKSPHGLSKIVPSLDDLKTLTWRDIHNIRVKELKVFAGDAGWGHALNKDDIYTRIGVLRNEPVPHFMFQKRSDNAHLF